MRKTILISVILALCALSFAQLTITSDFTYEDSSFSKIASGTFNLVTNHFYACDYDDASYPVSILNADGTVQSPEQTLSVAGVPLGSLNVFSIACTSDGVIYGGSNEVTEGTTPQTFIRWENESATPTYQQFGTGAGDLLFLRAICVRGTGTDTVIASCGSGDDAAAQILTTSDGSTFAIAETTQALTGCKQGIAINADGSIIFCAQSYMGNVPHKWVPSGTPGTWNEETTFAPLDAEVFCPILMAYWDDEDILFGVSGKATGGELLMGLDNTGAIITSVNTGIDLSIYGYGNMNITLSGTGGTGAWIGRNGPETGYACGKFTFDIPTPTETPIVEAANSVWGLYE